MLTDPDQDQDIRREWREYAAGGGAAIVAISMTFPINKIMFRQQRHAIPANQAVGQIYKEGTGHLYRGLLAPLCMRFISNSVMFGSYHQYSRVLRERLHCPVHVSKVCGAVMAGASEAMIMPLERVQVLMQDTKYNTLYKNTPDAFFKMRVHGISEYYRGLTAILLRNCPGNVIFFSSRERIKETLPSAWRASPYLANISDFLSGACLGAFISTIFYPVNVTKTHMQLVVGGDFLRFRSVFTKLLAERGVRGMFRGVHMNYTRSFIQWGIINVVYENLLRSLKTL